MPEAIFAVVLNRGVEIQVSLRNTMMDPHSAFIDETGSALLGAQGELLSALVDFQFCAGAKAVSGPEWFRKNHPSELV